MNSRIGRLATGILILLSAAWLTAQQAKPAPQGQQPPKPPPRAIPTDVFNTPWTGDFDGMLALRRIRVLMPFSRTFYFTELGRERGYAADLVRVFESHLNKTLAAKLGKRPITIVILSTTRDKLLSGVAEGLGDLAAGYIGVTDERKKLVDFVSAPDANPISEVVLTGPKSPAVNTVDDLSGKTVHVRPSSTYYESLMVLNERFKREGKAPVTVVEVPDALEDEDMMEMLNLGLFEVIIGNDTVATMWAKILPKMKVNRNTVLRTGVTGWAIRKNSPLLRDAIMDAYVNAVQNTPKTLGNRWARYSGRVRQLQDPTASADYRRFEDTVALFQKYGGRYHFDPLMLAAQGFQESRLDQEARSPVGAVGIMQVMPATGKELAVGDITIADPNVHAGTKYMDQLMSKTFPDAKFDDLNRSLFAFAAYNCGPGNVAKLRKEAEKRGLNPDVWFNNVELVTAEKIGLETTTYVRNIFKYYVSYTLTTAARETRKAAKETIKKAP